MGKVSPVSATSTATKVLILTQTCFLDFHFITALFIFG